MANIFNAAEAIDIGIEKEKKRRDFYGLAAKKFKEKEMKDLFGRLKDWEETHIKKFTEIRNSVEGSETTESYNGELETYIRSLVDDKLYSQVSVNEFDKNVKSPLQAISYGMGFERDAILFFNELAGYIPPHHSDEIRALIEEEKRHLVYLGELKKKYELPI